MFMVSQISTRANAFDARRPYGVPDYVFFSSLELVGQPREALTSTLSKHDYYLVTNVREFYLFRRGTETPETIAALRRLGLLSEPTLPGAPAAPVPSEQTPAPAAPEVLHSRKKHRPH
jgi:hypothetical protein